MASATNTALLEGLWKARNREGDTPVARAELRSWLRQAVRMERAHRHGYGNCELAIGLRSLESRRTSALLKRNFGVAA